MGPPSLSCVLLALLRDAGIFRVLIPVLNWIEILIEISSLIQKLRIVNKHNAINFIFLGYEAKTKDNIQ